MSYPAGEAGDTGRRGQDCSAGRCTASPASARSGSLNVSSPRRLALGKGAAMSSTTSTTVQYLAADSLRLKLSPVDLVLLLIYFSFVLGIGFALKRAVRSSLD